VQEGLRERPSRPEMRLNVCCKCPAVKVRAFRFCRCRIVRAPGVERSTDFGYRADPMSFRTLLLIAALAAVPCCVVHTIETGAVLPDGSVYLGWNLISEHGRAQREDYPVGQDLGAFSSIRLTADAPVELHRVTVIFADGERFAAPVPPRLG